MVGEVAGGGVGEPGTPEVGSWGRDLEFEIGKDLAAATWHFLAVSIPRRRYRIR
jgi:hypothetical protein